MRFSIRVKILGLAVFLLSFTILLAGFLLVQVVGIQRGLVQITTQELPLTILVAEMNEHGLRRRLAFERWSGALNSNSPNTRILSEAQTNYARFSERLAADFKTLHVLRGQLSPDQRQRLTDVLTLAKQIEEAYPRITARQREILDLKAAGQMQRANDILDVLNDIQASVQSQREMIQQRMESLVSDAVGQGVRRQTRVVWLTLLATCLLVALGVVVATLITERLVAPVRGLIAAIRRVETGNLDVQLPVSSTDEVGTLTASFNYFVQELRAKEQIKQTFGRYLDPRILDRVLAKSDALETGGGRRVMTVAFADLSGFTQLSELLTPGSLVNLLNRHFTLQSDAIQQHSGVVDKFIGDAVMAFWGPPFSSGSEHAIQACRAALAQQRAMVTFLSELPELTGLRKNVPKVQFRLGINTGEMIVGNLGSQNAQAYTVIGDAVNTASRIEGANKFYGTRLLISESTWRQAGGAIVAREVDLLAVKGKEEPTRVFELLALREDATPEVLRLCDIHARALAAYRASAWDDAEAGFQECLQLFPDDGPSRTFLGRIQSFRTSPPPAGWGGVWRMDEK